MMKRKDIFEWYYQIKEDYDKEEKTTDMDEGDFNVLECEYNTLRMVLGYDD